MLIAPLAAHAATTTYQFCKDSNGVSTCQTGGSTSVISNYAQTKYPLVLAHGMAGFSSIGGPSGLQYFYGINSDLAANGAQVFDTQVSSFDSSYVRGEQLLSQVKQIMAITGSSKVNLIGHSQGAIDIRYVAAVIPNQIASVTGVAGPQLGSPVADTIKSVSQTPILGGVLTPVLTGLVNAFFSLVDVSSGQYYSQSSLAGLNQLTSQGMAAYNAQFPQGMPVTTCGQGAATVSSPDGSNTIRYYSWGGTGLVTNLLDPSDALLTTTSLFMNGPSDGLVGQCSSHLGTVIRDNYNQNHLDEVNQIAGLVDYFSVSPVVLFRQHANRLKQAGV